MAYGKTLTVGSLCNVLLGDTWHGAIVTEVRETSADGPWFVAKLLEASDGWEVGQEISGLHATDWSGTSYDEDVEPANIKGTNVYIMRATRAADGSWFATGDHISVSHGRDSLPAAVGSMLESWEKEGRRERGEFPELPEAAAALLKDGRYWSEDRNVTYWFRFAGQ